MAHRSEATMVCCEQYTACLTNTGEIQMYGCHPYETREEYNEFRIEDKEYHSLKVPGLSEIQSLCTGFKHVIYMDSHGQVYTFGPDTDALGIGKPKVDPCYDYYTHDKIYISSEEDECQVYTLGSGGYTSYGNGYGSINAGYISDGNGYAENIDTEYSSDEIVQDYLPNSSYDFDESDSSEPEFNVKINKLNLPPVKQVSCGYNFNVCLTEDGEVYTFGSNGSYEIGQNVMAWGYHLYSPKIISSLKNIEFISCGTHHTVCKSYTNEFYSWGENDHGQLGIGSNKNVYSPVKCENWPENITDVKCGGSHTLVLTSIGTVYSCGNNEKGQLGRASTDCSVLNIIEDLSYITRMECGNSHSVCINLSEDLIVFGCNSKGQLGLGDTTDRNIPIKHPSLSSIIDISKGANHTLVKTSNNEIYGFGSNKCMQLGIRTEKKKQLTPIRLFEGNEDIWRSSARPSKAKSARN